MKTLLFTISIALTLISCNNNENEWITATIKKGQHNAKLDKPNIPAAMKRCIEFEFDESNRTDTTYNHVNKLYGTSDGWNHINHSVRIGYRYFADRGEIGIYAFSHIDGKFKFDLMGYCPINEICMACYEIKVDNYTYTYKGSTIVHERSKNRSLGGYHLKPYFGGHPTAPHDMTIRYREAKI